MLSRRAPWSALVAGLLLSVPAGAQTITFSSGSQNVVRHHSDPELDSNQINRQNCLDDEPIDFRMTIKGGNTSLRLGAWTGTGCDTEASRAGTNPTCVRAGSDIPVVENAVLRITVPEIIAAVERTSATGDTGEGGAGSGPSDCDGSAHPVGFSLNFLVLDTSGKAPSGFTGAKWDAKYDLEGPDAPSGVKVGIGENRLIVSWTAPSDTPQAELDGFYFFCDPPPGTGTPVVDGGSASCGAPTADAANACGHVLGGAASNGETSALTNGVNYAVAVSARDTFNNYGALSDTACEAPQPVTGFFEAYRAAGGKGGGGFCSIGGGRSPAFAGFGALTLLGLALRRRARSRKGAAS